MENAKLETEPIYFYFILLRKARMESLLFFSFAFHVCKMRIELASVAVTAIFLYLSGRGGGAFPWIPMHNEQLFNE